MDHTMMHHHSPEEQCSGDRRDVAMATGTRSSAGVGVSQVAFALSAVALILSLFSSSSLGGAAAVWASSSSSIPSGATLSARLAALCGLVTTKKALFLLSNAIFLFLAADCRCFFPGVCGMATTSASDDVVTLTPSEPPSSCVVQVQVPCSSYPRSLYCCSNTNSASADCSGGQGVKQEEVPVPSPPESVIVTLDLETVVVEEPTWHGVAEEAQDEELEKLEMDELNRKFEDFIQSRRIKWLKEEELVLQCHQVV